MGDQELVAKYQKLATAYAELKQKNAVLKNAVQDLSQRQQSGGGGGGEWVASCACVLPSLLWVRSKEVREHMGAMIRVVVTGA